MRTGIVILALVAVAAGLVWSRASALSARHDIQRLHNRRTELNRRLWDQQVRLGELTAPLRVRQRTSGGAADARSAVEPATEPDGINVQNE